MNAEEQNKLVDRFNELSKDPDVVKMFEQGLTTVRELKGVTDEEMNAVYTVAHNFYVTGRYADAETIFRFLVMFDHLNVKYWMGLGAVHQAQKHFKDALAAYANVVGNLDIENYKAAFYAAECFLALGDKTNAQNAIAQVKMYADVKTEDGRKFAAKVAKLEKIIAA